MRQFEAANTLREGPCKSTLFVPEQFVFKQARGNSRTVQLHEGMCLTRAELMNGAREQFLARAGLAADEHCRLGGGDCLHLLEHLCRSHDQSVWRGAMTMRFDHTIVPATDKVASAVFFADTCRGQSNRGETIGL